MFRKTKCTWSCLKTVFAVNSRLLHQITEPIESPQHHKRRYLSRMLIQSPTFYEFNPKPGGASQCRSQMLLMNNELIQGRDTGLYFFMPNALRALEKLTRLIDIELQEIGCQKISMPSLIGEDLWQKSGRWETRELFKLQDRHSQGYCLGPTHEEMITTLFANQQIMHKRLPVMLYQAVLEILLGKGEIAQISHCKLFQFKITRKFRDERRPRYGLLRSREFEMKDLYTFDVDLEAAADTYSMICEAYTRIFNRLGLDFIKSEGATGNIGGSSSHEYHLPADIGEDTVYKCTNCGFAANLELIAKDRIKKDQSIDCPKCSSHIAPLSGIEVGHAFLLGTKYSSVFNATYKTEAGKSILTEMGCYGLGVTRILQAGVEVLSKSSNIVWPSLMAPYQVCIVPNLDRHKKFNYDDIADSLYDKLNTMSNLRGEVVIFDSDKLTLGKKLSLAKQHGYPYIVAIGSKVLETPPLFEVINTRSGDTEFLSLDQVLHKTSEIETL